MFILERPAELGDTPLRKTVEAIVIQENRESNVPFQWCGMGMADQPLMSSNILDKLLDGLPSANRREKQRSPIESNIRWNFPSRCNEGANIAWDLLFAFYTGRNWIDRLAVKSIVMQTITLTAAVLDGRGSERANLWTAETASSRKGYKKALQNRWRMPWIRTEKMPQVDGKYICRHKQPMVTPNTWWRSEAIWPAAFCSFSWWELFWSTQDDMKALKEKCCVREKESNEILPEICRRMVLMLYAGS